MSLLLIGCLAWGVSGCQSLKLDQASELPAAPAEAATQPEPAKATPAGQPPASEPLPPTAGRELTTPGERSAAGPSARDLRERLDALTPQISLPAVPDRAAPLQLTEVQASVAQQFPLVLAAIQEAQVAAGKQQSARGAFDLKLGAESLNTPQGFYKNYRHRIKAEQPLGQGGALYGQYRLGDGDFPAWYGERETNEGGEFKLGLAAPLLRGRAIDERRADIARADWQAAAVDPQVQEQLIDSIYLAAQVYWNWVAAGQGWLVTQELLSVAEERNRGLQRQVELGNLAATEVQQNERLVAARQAKLVEANRKLQSSAIKLSLFLRDGVGDPVVPSAKQLPVGFPTLTDPRGVDLEAEIAGALDRRPELQQLNVARQIVNVDLQQAENELLPNLSAVVEASKDVGGPASSKRDKTPFEFEAGLLFDVPLQRNKAGGKIQSAQGKLSQLTLKQQFTINKIVAEVQDAHSARLAAFERIARARQNVELAKILVQAEYRSFDLGNSDLLRIAIQEAAQLDAQLMEIEALLDYFLAESQFSAASGRFRDR